MENGVSVRNFRDSDLLPIIALFRNTIRTVNVRDYTPEQVRAWAPDEIDPAKWRTFAGRYAIVAEMAGRQPDGIVGFADLETDGHLDRFFVHARTQNQGVGRALMHALLDEARRLGLSRVYSEVSVTAKPFFERQGFETIAEQSVEVRGERLTNYRMELRLES